MFENINKLKSVKIDNICNYNDVDDNGKELENGFDIVKFVWNYNDKIFVRIVKNDFDYGGSFGGSELIWGEDYKCEDGKVFIKFVDSLSEMGISDIDSVDDDMIDECFDLNYYWRG